MNDGLRDMLTVRQAAHFLGLSEPCLRTWIATRRIEFVRIGRRAVRIRRRVLANLVKRGTVPAESQ